VVLILSTVNGKPIWLLKLPGVAKTLYFVLNTDVINSLVVVFPLLPTIAMTGIFKVSGSFSIQTTVTGKSETDAFSMTASGAIKLN
jgi:hypothetical protein